MDSKEIVTQEPNLATVCSLTGILFFLEAISWMYINKIDFYKNVIDSPIVGIIGLLACFIVGMFILGSIYPILHHYKISQNFCANILFFLINIILFFFSKKVATTYAICFFRVIGTGLKRLKDLEEKGKQNENK
jgi:uncharacterized protein YacL